MKNIKLYIITPLLLVFFTQVLHKAGYIAYFKYNRTAIAEAFCVNKNKPEIKCDGKCHLKKYLDQEEEIAGENPAEKPCSVPNIEFLKTLNTYYLPQDVTKSYSFSSQNIFMSLIQNQWSYFYLLRVGRNYSSRILHPPIV